MFGGGTAHTMGPSTVDLADPSFSGPPVYEFKGYATDTRDVRLRVRQHSVTATDQHGPTVASVRLLPLPRDGKPRKAKRRALTQKESPKKKESVSTPPRKAAKGKAKRESVSTPAQKPTEWPTLSATLSSAVSADRRRASFPYAAVSYNSDDPTALPSAPRGGHIVAAAAPPPSPNLAC